MKVKNLLLILPFLFAFTLLTSDFKDQYLPIRNYNPSKVYLKKLATAFDSLVSNEEFDARKQRKEVKEAFKESKKELLSLDTAGLLMQNDTITAYLQSIADKICQKNPMLQNRRFNVMVLRDAEANAANWGAGVILFNLDLISRLKTEDELACVLGHEISHDIKGHVINTLEERYRIVHSEEFKKELRRIKSQEYNRFKQVEALLTKFLSRDSKSNRGRELEADSLGLIFIEKAGYAPSASVRLMEILDSCDNPCLKQKIDYNRYFNSASFPFKKSWLEEEEEETITGGNLATDLPDSLKTHPDCKIRIVALKRIAKRQNFDMTKQATTSNKFAYYGTRSYFELLEHCQSEYDMGDALYHNLQLLAQYPNNAYLKCSVVNCLYEIYVSKVDHYMSQLVDYPNKQFTPEYRQMLIFLHNINSEATRSIMMNYYDANVKDKINTPQSAYIATLLSSIDTPKKDRVKLIAQYKAKYNDAFYLGMLNRKFKPKP